MDFYNRGDFLVKNQSTNCDYFKTKIIRQKVIEGQNLKIKLGEFLMNGESLILFLEWSKFFGGFLRQKSCFNKIC